MRVGICQYEIEWENREKNMAKVMSYIAEAKALKLDIIFLPEMSLTGFSMQVEKTKDEYVGETIEKFKELCREQAIAAGFGWVEKEGESKAHNHYTIVDKNGNVLSDYVKIHQFRYGGEAKYFEGGSSVEACKFQEHKIATAICYDLRFPELFRIMDKDCSIIVIPANWPASRKEHWNCLLQARAIENQVYVIGINCVGTMNGTYYSGNSAVFDPLGKLLAEIHDKEGMICVDIPNDVESYRSSFPVRIDRRIEIEHKLGNGGCT